MQSWKIVCNQKEGRERRKGEQTTDGTQKADSKIIDLNLTISVCR